MAKNKVIDMDSAFDDLFFDEKKINHATAMVKRNENPEYLVKKNQALSQVMETEQWKINNAKSAKKWSNDPAWIEAQAERLKKRSENKTWKSNVTKAAKEKSKPCITPLGIFQSVHAAGNYYDEVRGTQCGKTVVCRNLKKESKGYRYIAQEEYTLLTGKEIV